MAAVESAIQQWSARWFVHHQYSMLRVSRRERGYRALKTDVAWMAWGNSVALAYSADDGIGIARQALDATRTKVDVRPRDKVLLQSLAEQIGRDLVAALMFTLKYPMPSTAEAAPVTDPFFEGGGIEIDIVCDAAMSPMRIVIPFAMIVPLRKYCVGSTPLPAPEKFAITDALGTEPLAFSATLGSACLSISETQRLSIGDVIVLDTRLCDAIPFVSEKTRRTIGKAVVAQKDGRVELVVRATSGV
jgi:hypothetical protein